MLMNGMPFVSNLPKGQSLQGIPQFDPVRAVT
jgi:hypothetical protein